MREKEDSRYLFNLQPFKDREVECVIDGARKGNLSRFFNHSCEPNMAPSYAYIENHYIGAPRIAFFATRDIARDEELTINYGYGPADEDSETLVMQCKCSSTKCKVYLV